MSCGPSTRAARRRGYSPSSRKPRSLCFCRAGDASLNNSVAGSAGDSKPLNLHVSRDAFWSQEGDAESHIFALGQVQTPSASRSDLRSARRSIHRRDKAVQALPYRAAFAAAAVPFATSFPWVPRLSKVMSAFHPNGTLSECRFFDPMGTPATMLCLGAFSGGRVLLLGLGMAALVFDTFRPFIRDAASRNDADAEQSSRDLGQARQSLLFLVGLALLLIVGLWLGSGLPT